MTAYRFGRFELDEDTHELRRNGEPVALQPLPRRSYGHHPESRQGHQSRGAARRVLAGCSCDPRVSGSDDPSTSQRPRRGATRPARDDPNAFQSGYRFVAEVVTLARSRPCRARSEILLCVTPRPTGRRSLAGNTAGGLAGSARSRRRGPWRGPPPSRRAWGSGRLGRSRRSLALLQRQASNASSAAAPRYPESPPLWPWTRCSAQRSPRDPTQASRGSGRGAQRCHRSCSRPSWSFPVAPSPARAQLGPGALSFLRRRRSSARLDESLETSASCSRRSTPRRCPDPSPAHILCV